MNDTCSICNKPILPGDARYTGGEHRGIFRHWDCYEPELKEHKALVKEILGDKKIRKSPVRPGKGPVAKKMAKLLSEVAKRELGFDIHPDDFRFWVQPPAYRGPRWDLAIWGADVQHPEHSAIKIAFHSWEPMTKLAKQKELSLHLDGLHQYDVG